MAFLMCEIMLISGDKCLHTFPRLSNQILFQLLKKNNIFFFYFQTLVPSKSLPSYLLFMMNHIQWNIVKWWLCKHEKPVKCTVWLFIEGRAVISCPLNPSTDWPGHGLMSVCPRLRDPRLSAVPIVIFRWWPSLREDVNRPVAPSPFSLPGFQAVPALRWQK